jgi:hypothetical protein
LQTEGQKQFRINRQVCIVLVATLIALALPLAGVILTLQSLTKAGEAQAPQESESGVSDALKSMLEGIADEKLAPEELRNGDARIELTTGELNGERVRIEGLLKSYGGFAIPTLESEAEIRLLVQVPAEHLEEFLVSLRDGKEKGGAINDASGGVLKVVIKKTDSR